MPHGPTPRLTSRDDAEPLTAARLGSVTRSGWLSCVGTLESARLAAAELGWSEAPVRRGDVTVSRLRPVKRDDAHPRSLSAIVGLEAQPLHTDGAHLSRPPDIIVLASTQPSRTATRLLDTANDSAPHEALLHGVFSVSAGPHRFYATASSADGVGYDPGCMNPCDQRARTVADYFAHALDDAHRHEWTVTGGQLLCIDNRRVLHAREAVGPADAHRELERVAFWIPEDR